MQSYENSSHERIEEWAQIFLEYIRKQTLPVHVREDEGYKFQSVDNFKRHFDIEAVDLAGNLAESIENNNLVAGAMYFPRKMLLIYAHAYPEKTRQALKDLFDESEDVSVRITNAQHTFEDFERQRAEEASRQPHHTYIGLRFLSLLLGYRYPEKYNPLKPAEWKVFARFINPDFSMPQHTAAGDQYMIYNNFIEPLRTYIQGRTDFKAIKDQLTQGLAFGDDEFRWTTQDVIFVTAKVYANQRVSSILSDAPMVGHEESVETADSNEDPSHPGTGFMRLELHLEEYVIENWDKIDFGEKLRLYLEEDGTTGQQFTTDVGIIDILAMDSDDNFVVIELKRAEYGYKVVGQILNYMGWVKDRLAKDDQKVRGMIIVGKADKTLVSAVRPVSDMVSLKEYKVHMHLQEPRSNNPINDSAVSTAH